MGSLDKAVRQVPSSRPSRRILAFVRASIAAAVGLPALPDQGEQRLKGTAVCTLQLFRPTYLMLPACRSIVKHTTGRSSLCRLDRGCFNGASPIKQWSLSGRILRRKLTWIDRPAIVSVMRARFEMMHSEAKEL